MSDVKLDAAQERAMNELRSARERRNDSWYNARSRFGSSADPVIYSRFFRNRARLTRDELESLYEQDPWAARVCDIWAEDATREWVTFLHEANPDFAQKITERDEELGGREFFANGIRWGRLHGGCLGIVGAQDGQDPAEELDIKRIKSITYTRLYDRWMSYPATWYDDPEHPKFGETEVWRINRLQFVGAPSVLVHESRLLRFDGNPLPPLAKVRNWGWSASALDKVYDALRNWGMTNQAAASVVPTFITHVMKIGNLKELIQNGQWATIRRRLGEVHAQMSTNNLAFYGAEEEFQKLGTPISGLDSFLDKFMGIFAGAANVPKSVFFFGEPGALGGNSGKSDRDNWYDSVSSYQNTGSLQRNMGRWVNFLEAEQGIPLNTIKWEWNPLAQLTDLQWAELHAKNAQADQIYVNSGMVDDPSRMGVYRFGGGKYNPNPPVLNMERQEAYLEELAEEPMEPPPGPQTQFEAQHQVGQFEPDDEGTDLEEEEADGGQPKKDRLDWDAGNYGASADDVVPGVVHLDYDKKHIKNPGSKGGHIIGWDSHGQPIYGKAQVEGDPHLPEGEHKGRIINQVVAGGAWAVPSYLAEYLNPKDLPKGIKPGSAKHHHWIMAHHKHGITVSQIAAHAGLATGNVSKVVNQLIASGHVVKVGNSVFSTDIAKKPPLPHPGNFAVLHPDGAQKMYDKTVKEVFPYYSAAEIQAWKAEVGKAFIDASSPPEGHDPDAGLVTMEIGIPKPPAPPSPSKAMGGAGQTGHLYPAADIMHTEVAPAKGSNAGGVYKAADGKLHYVKKYEDKAQAYCEHVANNVYKALGMPVAESKLVQGDDGQVWYASEYNPALADAQLGLSPSKAHASKLLEGVVADALLANWDVVGQTGDNVLLNTDGQLVRIDNGGSLLFRAKAGRKKASDLHDVSGTLAAFGNAGTNPAYAKYFKTAGYNTLADIAPEAIKQIQVINTLRGATKDFADLVPIVGDVPVADRSAVMDMLRARSDKLNTDVMPKLVAALAGKQQAAEAQKMQKKAVAWQESFKSPLTPAVPNMHTAKGEHPASKVIKFYDHGHMVATKPEIQTISKSEEERLRSMDPPQLSAEAKKASNAASSQWYDTLQKEQRWAVAKWKSHSSSMVKAWYQGKTDSPDYAQALTLMGTLHGAPKWEGAAWRGMGWDDEESYIKLMQTVAAQGEIQLNAPQGFSQKSNLSFGKGEKYYVQYVVKSKTMRNVAPVGGYDGEVEMIALPGTRYKVLHYEEHDMAGQGKGSNRMRTTIYMEEI